MISIGFRYTFRKLIIAFLFIAPIIIGMVWLAVSMKYIELIVSDEISIKLFLSLISLVLPEISATITPICFLISSILVFQKLQSDKELIVFMTSGKSKSTLFRPLGIFAIILTAVTFYLQTNLSPYSHKKLSTMQDEIRTSLSTSVIKQGTFNVIGKSVIYIGRRTNNAIEDVFISFKKPGKTTNIVTAKKGACVLESDKFYLVLDNGTRLEFNEKHELISSLNFESFTYDVSQVFARYGKYSSHERNFSQSELLKLAKETEDEQLKNIYISEFHARQIQPFIILINALIIGICMIVPGSGRGKSFGSIRSFVFGILNQVFFLSAVKLTAKDSTYIMYNYVLIVLLIVFLYSKIIRGNKL